MAVFLVAVFSPMVTAVIESTLFTIVMRRQRRDWMIALGVAAACLIVLGSLAATYTFGGGFGPGAFYCLATLISGVVMIFVMPYLRARTMRETNFAQIESRIGSSLSNIVVLTIICSLLIPPAGGAVYSEACDQLHRWIASSITPALQEYKAATGSYPNKLEALVPNYLDPVPAAICMPLHGPVSRLLGVSDSDSWSPGFFLLDCTEATYLAVPVTGLGWTQRLNLATGEWSVRDFLDDEC